MPQIACPSCAAALAIPDNTSIDSFRCPSCQKMLRLNRRSNLTSSKAEATSAPLSTEPAHTTPITTNESLLPPKVSAARRLGEWMRHLVNRANSSPLINKARKDPRIVMLGIVLACLALAFGGWQFIAWITSDPVSYNEFSEAYTSDFEDGAKTEDEIARLSGTALRTYARQRTNALRREVSRLRDTADFAREGIKFGADGAAPLFLLTTEKAREKEKAAKIYERMARYGMTREGAKKLTAYRDKP